MPKFPDLSKLGEKLNIEGVIDDMKTMISPDKAIPEDASKDPKTALLAEVMMLLDGLATEQSKQAKQMSQLSVKLKELYRLVEPVESEAAQTSKSEVEAKVEKAKVEEPAAVAEAQPEKPSIEASPKNPKQEADKAQEAEANKLGDLDKAA